MFHGDWTDMRQRVRSYPIDCFVDSRSDLHASERCLRGLQHQPIESTRVSMHELIESDQVRYCRTCLADLVPLIAVLRQIETSDDDDDTDIAEWSTVVRISSPPGPLRTAERALTHMVGTWTDLDCARLPRVAAATVPPQALTVIEHVLDWSDEHDNHLPLEIHSSFRYDHELADTRRSAPRCGGVIRMPRKPTSR
ncbi:MAG: hypothetical protein ACOYL9_11285 [Ilumatobacteraceae bacterium]